MQIQIHKMGLPSHPVHRRTLSSSSWVKKVMDRSTRRFLLGVVLPVGLLVFLYTRGYFLESGLGFPTLEEHQGGEEVDVGAEGINSTLGVSLPLPSSYSFFFPLLGGSFPPFLTAYPFLSFPPFFP